jgi:hypothetical protein
MMGRRAFLLTIAFAFAVNAACASKSGGGAKEQSTAPKAEQPAKKEEAKAAKGVPAPAGSPFSKVSAGMSDTEVRKILGEPDDSNGYITGKSFIPWYYGSDTSRSDWVYNGKGRIVFSRNRYSGTLKVVEVLYNPSESGAKAK